MKKMITIGKPTHLKVTTVVMGESTSKTACGLYGRHYDAAYDPRDVDCMNCINTKEYKTRNSIDTK